MLGRAAGTEDLFGLERENNMSKIHQLEQPGRHSDAGKAFGLFGGVYGD
jgi:hypothetical protein